MKQNIISSLYISCSNASLFRTEFFKATVGNVHWRLTVPFQVEKALVLSIKFLQNS